MWQFTDAKYSIDQIKSLRNSTELKRQYMEKIIKERNYKPFDFISQIEVQKQQKTYDDRMINQSQKSLK